MTSDWNPQDPDAVSVVYDLSAWSFDHQADLAAELAEAGVPHSWSGAELVVPEEYEAPADAVIASVEERFGIDTDEIDDGTADEVVVPLPLDPGRLVTEYDLTDWTMAERDAVSRALWHADRPFEWVDAVLVVHADDEAVVDSLLDMVEQGQVGTAADEAPDADGRPPFETLTTFFLMAERLRRDPLDADGLEQLLDALDLAEPASAPYGVDPRLWARTCELADELAGALADDEHPDHEAAMSLADELHDLLRPYI